MSSHESNGTDSAASASDSQAQNGTSLTHSEGPLKTFREWMAEGEVIYTAAYDDFQQLEQQLAELEDRLAAKKVELNDIAKVVGRPPVESARRVAASVVEAEVIRDSNSAPAGSVARALSGRGLIGR